MLNFMKNGKKLMTEKDNGEIKVNDKDFAQKLQEFVAKENVEIVPEVEAEEEDK